jgi:hypothetical protein
MKYLDIDEHDLKKLDELLSTGWEADRKTPEAKARKREYAQKRRQKLKEESGR